MRLILTLVLLLVAYPGTATRLGMVHQKLQARAPVNKANPKPAMKSPSQPVAQVDALASQDAPYIDPNMASVDAQLKQLSGLKAELNKPDKKESSAQSTTSDEDRVTAGPISVPGKQAKPPSGVNAVSNNAKPPPAAPKDSAPAPKPVAAVKPQQQQRQENPANSPNYDAEMKKYERVGETGSARKMWAAKHHGAKEPKPKWRAPTDVPLKDFQNPFGKQGSAAAREFAKKSAYAGDSGGLAKQRDQHITPQPKHVKKVDPNSEEGIKQADEALQKTAMEASMKQGVDGKAPAGDAGQKPAPDSPAASVQLPPGIPKPPKYHPHDANDHAPPMFASPLLSGPRHPHGKPNAAGKANGGNPLNPGGNDPGADNPEIQKLSKELTPKPKVLPKNPTGDGPVDITKFKLPAGVPAPPSAAFHPEEEAKEEVAETIKKLGPLDAPMDPRMKGAREYKVVDPQKGMENPQIAANLAKAGGVEPHYKGAPKQPVYDEPTNPTIDPPSGSIVQSEDTPDSGDMKPARVLKT